MSRLSATRSVAVPRVGVALSTKTRFRGPVVGQTSLGRWLNMRRGGVAARSACKCTWSEAPVADVVIAGSACHAGGRGFEARRSRLLKCLQIGICVAGSDAACTRPTSWIPTAGTSMSSNPAPSARCHTRRTDSRVDARKGPGH
jgi:hypothetical protein